MNRPLQPRSGLRMDGCRDERELDLPVTITVLVQHEHGVTMDGAGITEIARVGANDLLG